MILTRAASIVMLPVYTRYLTPADYGVMALIELTLEFIAIIGGSRLAVGVFRFYHKVDSDEERMEMVSTAFLLIGGLYVLLGAAVFIAAAPLSRMLFGSEVNTVLVQVAAANLGVRALVIVPLAFARLKDWSTFYVGVSAVKLVLSIALNVLFLVVLGMGVLGMMLGALVANAIIGVFVGVWLLRHSGVAVSRVWTRRLVVYGLPLIASRVATFMATFSDRYFLQAWADETSVGLYNLSYEFGFLLVMVGFGPMFQVWGPRRFKVANEPNRDAVLSHGFLIMNVLLFTTAIGITLYVEDVLRIITTPQFHAAHRVVPVILIAYILQCWADATDIGILVKEKTRYVAVADWVAAFVAVIGYSILIPRYLEWGAAAATILSFGTRFVLTYSFSQMVWRVKYRWGPVWLLAAWATVVALVGLSLPEMPVLTSLAARTALVGVFGVGVWFLPILSQDDRRAAVAIVGEKLGVLRARFR